MASMIDSGLSAMLSYQRAMEVTSQNISNAGTPGYSRQVASLQAKEGQILPIGVVGRGVEISNILRVSDLLVNERLRSSFSEQGRLTTLGESLADTELVFNEPGEAGLSATIDRLFATLEDLSNNPESSALRTGAVQQLQTVASTINAVSDQLDSQFNGLRTAAEEQVRDANSLIDQISEINVQIESISASGRSPNDLFDRREELLRQLTETIGVGVTYLDDASIRVELNGSLLIGSTSGRQLQLLQNDGALGVVFADSGESVDVPGGNLAAVIEMGAEIIPGIIRDFDELAGGLIRNFNAAHATGTNHLSVNTSFVAENVIRGDLTSVNLDDVSQDTVDARNGIAQVLLPDFTDGQGNLTTKNLAINVLDTATGLAEKFVVRYDPGTDPGGASRSLEDLAAAINSGTGGGFSVEPPFAGGVNGVTASLVSVEGGRRLTLQVPEGQSIDFSPSMDVELTANAWRGDQVDVSGTADATALAAGFSSTRVVFTYASVGNTFTAHRLDTQTKAVVPFPDGVTAATFDASVANDTVNGLTLTFPSGNTFVDGQTFSVDLDASGNVVGGPASITNAWTDGAATVEIRGRYTGTHSYDPARAWSMRVVQGGTVGDNANAPVVEFAFYTGPDDARIRETIQVTLDDNYPAGSQIPIGEGLYAVLGSGSLTQSDEVTMVVEGQPDQAGLLTALGVNTLFSGSAAGDMRVSERIADEPDLFAVARTRSPGDNSNLLAMRAVREQDNFGSVGVSLDDFYQGIVSDVSVRIAQTESLADNQDLIQASLENRRDDISGVNIDEEVGQLILQQQAYQAAARVISFARENIQTLIQAIS